MIMAVAALVVTAVAAVGSAVMQSRAASEQRRQNRLVNRIEANKQMRSIKQNIALNRVRQAETQAAGFRYGVQSGSAVSGAVGSQTSDLAGAIGAANQNITGQQAIANISDRISRLQTGAMWFQTAGQISSMFVGGEGSAGAQNREAISNLFS